MEFNVLDDFEVEGKTVLVRVDVNSPIDPETGEIIDDYRIRKCSDTVRYLSEKGAKVVLIAHQGRPGEEDFTTLERHSEKMNEVFGFPVDYVDEIFGSSAREAIGRLDNGEILLLENVRFYSEEVLNRPPEQQAETHMVRKLSPLADLFVNDAFAAAHRSQPSLVGFGVELPAIAGRLMEKELKGLGKARNPSHPCIHVLGGAKVEDSLSLIKHVLGRELADRILVGGLVGQLFLVAEGFDIGKTNLEIIEERAYEEEIVRAKEIISNYEENITSPIDLRIENSSGNPEVISTEDLPTSRPIYDIGDETIEKYGEIINSARTVVANGPVGVFEKKGFDTGTRGILSAISKSDAFTVIGGGHLVASSRDLGVADKVDHVSTGGGACLSFLSGEKLPVVELLKKESN